MAGGGKEGKGKGGKDGMRREPSHFEMPYRIHSLSFFQSRNRHKSPIKKPKLHQKAFVSRAPAYICRPTAGGA